MLLLHFGQGYDGLSYCIFGDSGPSIRKVALKTANDYLRGSFPSAIQHMKADKGDECGSISNYGSSES